MKANTISLLSYCIFFSISCSPEKQNIYTKFRQTIEQQLGHQVTDDLSSLLQYYDVQDISMPEYQLTLSGRAEIEVFYKEIFARQNVKTFQRQSDEFIHMDSTIALTNPKSRSRKKFPTTVS